jgi:lipoprotein-anchoring transpeptidase ErfK/SrfK
MSSMSTAPLSSGARRTTPGLAGRNLVLYRIHGTNQPEYIGHAISSGCIRMTNKDVIDLVDRMKRARSS